MPLIQVRNVDFDSLLTSLTSSLSSDMRNGKARKIGERLAEACVASGMPGITKENTHVSIDMTSYVVGAPVTLITVEQLFDLPERTPEHYSKLAKGVLDAALEVLGNQRAIIVTPLTVNAKTLKYRATYAPRRT